MLQVTYQEATQADSCIEYLNNRCFRGRVLTVQVSDGREKFLVAETEAQFLERLKRWENFIAGTNLCIYFP